MTEESRPGGAGGGQDPRDAIQESGQLPEEGPPEQTPEDRPSGRDTGPDRQRDDDRANTGNPASAGE